MRRQQCNLWVDKDFLAWLKRLKGKKEAEGEQINNLGDLTRLILGTDAIKEVEQQILKHKNLNEIKLKLDAKRLWN